MSLILAQEVASDTAMADAADVATLARSKPCGH